MSVLTAVKYALAPMMYRYPPIGLQPSELGVYLHELLTRAGVPGDVAEVGCSVGGTACLAAALVKRYSPHKTYTCFDTFCGFITEHFDADVAIGTPETLRRSFSESSPKLVRRILDLHGCDHVRLVEGDIATVSDEYLSDRYSVILLDVDLAEPTYAALHRFYPRLSPGGVILIDDCGHAEQRWRALAGYKRFCDESGVTPLVRYGFGVVEKAR